MPYFGGVILQISTICRAWCFLKSSESYRWGNEAAALHGIPWGVYTPPLPPSWCIVVVWQCATRRNAPGMRRNVPLCSQSPAIPI